MLSPLLRPLSWLRRPWKPLSFSNPNFIRIPASQKIEEETIPGYVAARYYPVRIGEIFQRRYQVGGKTGVWSEFDGVACEGYGVSVTRPPRIIKMIIFVLVIKALLNSPATIVAIAATSRSKSSSRSKIDGKATGQRAQDVSAPGERIEIPSRSWCCKVIARLV